MKKPNVKGILGSTKLRRGSFSVLMIVLVIAAAVLINVGVSLLDSRFGLSVDLSSNKLYTISQQTEKSIAAIDEPVTLYALMRQGAEVIYITELLENYRRINPDMITVAQVDPVQNPAFAAQFDGMDLSDNSIIVTNQDGSKARLIDYYDMFEIAYDSNTYQAYPKAFKGEQAVTNAIAFVTADYIRNVYFLSGHREVDLSTYSYVTQYLEAENLQVSTLASTNLDTLQQGDILVIAGPQTDLTEQEQLILKDFLENDGYMLYMADAGIGELPYFESLLELYNVYFNHDFVVEVDSSNYYMNQVVIVPTIGSHESVKGLTENSQAAIMPVAQSFGRNVLQSGSYSVETTLSTSANAYGKKDLQATSPDKEEGDVDGPLDIGLVIRQVDDEGNDAGTKIVLLGNNSFVTNQSYYGLSGNIDLFMGSIKWLMGESDTVTIIGKNLMGNTLRFTSATQIYTLAAIVVVVVPLIILIAGFVVWIRRRHL